MLTPSNGSFFSLTQVLKRYQKAWNLDIKIQPRYLGAVMVASGNKPPITVVNKGIWMNKVDLPLCSKYFQIPIQFPDSFPIQTLHVIRLLRVIQDEAPDRLESILDCFYEQIWTPKSNGATAASKPENFRKVIPTSLANDSELKNWFEKSTSEENKTKIKLEGQELVEKGGAFGFLMAFFLGKRWDGPFPKENEAKL
ncbi:hypothetical protein OIO90_001377 [Microbotryomycetes sp. JL221]|nr:hypothetical protein OIO90_001377 [Microbotryomycetes sp. JL221]